ncbi:hypothetical protein CHS0354_016413 [Potamilus streckersoni]|uniref:Dermatopontin n=1 Tax=Potamilus streckersoni TaxID=2493646 RepID=A0AAE0SVV8_9BIVA|nr:hypothetical protein CHS0354_016413 [Potamilus streckersoni]
MSTTFILLLLMTFMVIGEPITLATGERILTTEYDKEMVINCEEPNFFLAVTSNYSTEHKDRKWEFTCGLTSHIRVSEHRSRCSWSGYINQYERDLNEACGRRSGFIEGIRSIYKDYYGDRRWSFYCCYNDDYTISRCKTTDQLNKYQGRLNYRFQDGYVLRGVSSVHNNNYKDRIFTFEVCSLDYVYPD